MKKVYVISGIVVICLLAIGVGVWIYTKNQASASVAMPTTSDIAIYKSSSYYQATYVKTLLKPGKASRNIFVIKDNQIYPTDGIKRDKTDTTAPAADQMKVELARGYFYLAYKDYPNSLSEVPEAKRSDVWAYETKLYYNSGNIVPNNMAICTRSGKTYLATTYRNGYGACDMLAYGQGMLVDLRGTAKSIVREKVQPPVDEE